MDFSESISQAALQSENEILQIFQTSRTGLTNKEALQRIDQYGPNVIPTKEKTLFHLFLKQWNDPFVYLLLVASILAFGSKDVYNGFLILFFIAIDVFFSFYQEAKARNILLYLNKKLALTCTLLRDNKIISIDKTLLVPGDIVIFTAGTIVSADIRVLEAHSLVIDESILTGESTNIIKTSQPLTTPTDEIFKMNNILFAGSHILRGQGKGIVIATGTQSQIGSIAQLVAEVRPPSSYVKGVKQFSKTIALIAFVSIPLIIIIQFIINPTVQAANLIIFAIALIVGIIPEAFPAVIAFALGRAAITLDKNNVIIKRLSSIEDLADIDILCVDKTGTLTENKMNIADIIAQDTNELLLFGLLSIEDPHFLTNFDAALLEKIDPVIRQKAATFKLIFKKTFDSESLTSNAVVQDSKGEKYLIVRGAPEVLLQISSHFNKPKKTFENLFKEKGEEGKRILAIAIKPIKNDKFNSSDENNLTFLGFFSFIDPIKPSAQRTIESAKKFGINVKVLTGDAKEVAYFITKEIGLISSPQQIINAQELKKLSDAAFEKTCFDNIVFSRVTPTMKLKILNTLQKKYAVGFLGDGINDTPALQAAHVGIVVKEAVDIARQAADIIILEKNLSILIFAIKEGRKIFANIDTYVKTTLSSNLGNYYSIGLLALVLPYLPILPIQILLVNLLSDLPLLAISTDHVLPKDLKEPKQYQLGKGLFFILFLASISVFLDLALFGLYYNTIPIPLIRTLWFILSVLTEIGLIFIVRNHSFFYSKPYPSIALITASLTVILFTVALPFTNLGHLFSFSLPTYSELLTISFLLVSYLIINELAKLFYFKKISPSSTKKNKKKSSF
ncbi:MAG: HAD-IC family P-type ATPase [Candidatus Babeliales bacterium]